MYKAGATTYGFGVKINAWPAIIHEVHDNSSTHQASYDSIVGRLSILPDRENRFIGHPTRDESYCLDTLIITHKTKLAKKIVSLGVPVWVIITGTLEKRTSKYGHPSHLDSIESKFIPDSAEPDPSQGKRAPLIATAYSSDKQLLTMLAEQRYANYCHSCGSSLKAVPGESKKFCPTCWR